MTRMPDWGSIGRSAVITSLVAAVIAYFAIPDYRWIAGVLVAIAVLDGFIFWFLVPRLQGGGTGGAPSLSELDQMNAQANWTPAEPPDPEGERRDPGR